MFIGDKFSLLDEIWRIDAVVHGKIYASMVSNSMNYLMVEKEYLKNVSVIPEENANLED